MRTYSLADAFQEKSLFIPLRIRVCQDRLVAEGLERVLNGEQKRFSAVVGELEASSTIPVRASQGSMVSSSPPVARTTGTVPYLRL